MNNPKRVSEEEIERCVLSGHHPQCVIHHGLKCSCSVIKSERRIKRLVQKYTNQGIQEGRRLEQDEIIELIKEKSTSKQDSCDISGASALYELLEEIQSRNEGSVTTEPYCEFTTHLFELSKM